MPANSSLHGVRAGGMVGPFMEGATMQHLAWGLHRSGASSAALLISALACGLAACSGNATNDSGDGGATGTGGSGTAGSSSSTAGSSTAAEAGKGGASALLAQGAVTIQVGQPTTPVDQMSCPIAQTYQIGAPQAPSQADPGESVVSGDGGSQIACSVKGQGPFSFSGSLRATTDQGDTISIAFFNGAIGTGDTGTVDVTLYTPELSANFSGTACTVTVENQQVKGGALWAAFHCSQVSSPPSGLCGVQGVVVFENCDGSSGP